MSLSLLFGCGLKLFTLLKFPQIIFMLRLIFSLLTLTVLLTACGSNRNGKTVPEKSSSTAKVRVFDPVTDYRAARPLDMKVVHTKLYLKPDFKNAWMYGTAFLTIQPHFYAGDSLILDAKGFAISRLEYVGDDYFKSLPYTYDGEQIRIYLEFAHSAKTNFEILVEYIAKPNELKGVGGSAAIQGAKGLYFINGDGSDPNKPTQLWTQGETESNSCWYPTIDAPNQKTTQEIYLTVDTGFVTLSNGELVYSTDNGDGSRTDYWKQELAHAPYLTMLAVGKFHVERESWRGKEVSYYVEPEFAATAKATYPNTVEMLEFYSKQLGVPYPWHKYAQISVRDYVSGAMENTTAVIFGEWAQRTERELIDGSSESTVAHEMYHHWFGDLVTCESWSNISVNESFATYGSYLWDEHKYGRFDADQGLHGNLLGYLNESKRKQEDLVRFYYGDKEEVFDSHSYAKGSRILHMLRTEVGDEAFFASLKLFLTRHAHQAVEIHQLRLAFEEVTGRDLNWFFNQWYFAKGHPVLEIKTNYDAVTGEVVVNIAQLQDVTTTPQYRLPMEVDVYTGSGKTTHKIVLTALNQSFRFKSSVKPELVNVDARKVLLAEKIENKSTAEYLVQWQKAPLYLDKLEALQNLQREVSNPQAKAVFEEAFGFNHWQIRAYAIEKWNFDQWKSDARFAEQLKTFTRSDADTRVRAAALEKLGETNAKMHTSVFVHSVTTDSSYRVNGTALRQLAKADSSLALEFALGFEDVRYVRSAVYDIYGNFGDASKADFFERNWATAGNQRFQLMNNYTKLALRINEREFIGRVISFYSAQDPTLSGWQKRTALEQRKKLETALTKLK